MIFSSTRPGPTLTRAFHRIPHNSPSLQHASHCPHISTSSSVQAVMSLLFTMALLVALKNYKNGSLWSWTSVSSLHLKSYRQVPSAFKMSSIFMYEPYYSFDRFLEQAMKSPGNTSDPSSQLERTSSMGPRTLRPRMDLHEDNEKNLVTAVLELPGAKKSDVQLDVHDGQLTISAETKYSTDHDENGYAVRERRVGKFSRSLRLPLGTKDSDIKASMVDGVLTVSFPKRSPEQEPRKITIN
ncbi:hypothetical protein NP233_g4297 [Leucocoprinus birnbaumii]|uniref:SHSP domain-containing protein n=1 Tax=Leucocoprinus birnbaumii TaxID=56174 RepID=A0AAD5YVM9_9AGAR|nr:hypothetical protein NP233_g4297 [Leucocoprinus birnbaumii]